MRCEWAACREGAFRQVDGWWMCEPHKQEHDSMFAPPPTVVRRPPTPRPKPRELRPCGTRSAAARHRTVGEEVCEPCRQAEADYYHQRWLRKKQAA